MRDGGAPLPLGLGVCKERQRHALPIGAALSRGACASCRAYVHDAVSVLRRTGMVVKPSDRDGCEAVGRSAVQASAVTSAGQAVQTDGALYKLYKRPPRSA